MGTRESGDQEVGIRESEYREAGIRRSGSGYQEIR